ncbi:uncharacterized [Tachysurus ichikawai]
MNALFCFVAWGHLWGGGASVIRTALSVGIIPPALFNLPDNNRSHLWLKTKSTVEMSCGRAPSAQKGCVAAAPQTLLHLLLFFGQTLTRGKCARHPVHFRQRSDE